MTLPVLRAESLGRRFGTRQILKAATLHAWPGRITAVLGRNGCGKSTLLRTIVGVVPPDYGAVHFAGRVYLRPRLHQLARAGLFYVPERGLATPYLSLAQHFALSGATPDRCLAAARELGLSERLDLFGHQLSPGERRRADLAFALLRAPACLLADEPFQGVAPLDAERIAAALRVQRERGTAIVITGHETGPLFDIADDIVWMYGGTVHWLGPLSAARSHDQFMREYLGC